MRYFQHLAALHTEIVLDRQARGPVELLRSLNDFVRRRNAKRVPGEAALPDFDRADLAKLAFWMATGSGKTLIFHLNYLQYLHYARRPPDNIVLITPNEGLSEQHLLELAASGISARRFDEAGGLFRSGADAIRVIEVTKLVEEKRGGGASVPVDYFEGENLIFVDEAHKGSGGEKWRTVRDRLGETGFTFEYSATFGQALGAARNEALTDEYGKAIAFDYSYRYFHGDGFGKDFGILNLKEWAADETTDLLLFGNLLSFYQQQRVFAERREEVRPYGIDKPLWVFVGGRVNAVYSRDGIRRSDVLTVVRFLQRFASDRRWGRAPTRAAPGWAFRAGDGGEERPVPRPLRTPSRSFTFAGGVAERHSEPTLSCGSRWESPPRFARQQPRRDRAASRYFGEVLRLDLHRRCLEVPETRGG